MNRAWIALLLFSGAASASPSPAAPEVAASQASPELAGLVTDSAGQPIEGATVFVAAKRRATTDANGRYHVVLDAGGTYSVVFEYGSVRDGHRVTIANDGVAKVDGALAFDRGEVIVIHDPLKQPVRAKPLKDPRILPPYSDEAILSDTWAKAWLVLDVDETGAVTRVKVLAHPGHDLDAIALSQALKTRFDPARDAHDRPTRSLVVWPIEWPAYWWMHDRLGLVTRMPDKLMDGFDVSHVPCRGSGPINVGSIHPAYRDCSVPNLSKINSAEPWIEAQRH
jgi:carboxypeptidase family protein